MSGSADRLAAKLDLDVDEVGICHACLSFVSFALDRGDESEIRRETNRMTPVLWAEGLALPAQLALERARSRGVAGVEDALADISARGARSAIAKAIVRRLATDLAAATERELRRAGWRLQEPTGHVLQLAHGKCGSERAPPARE